MKSIPAKNINFAYNDGLWWLKTAGTVESSRNGRVIVAPGPVMTCYERPDERVLFDELRDANPFFHLAEAIWMLAGANELGWLSQFNSNITNFSDDGGLTTRGAYGERWRHHWKTDQLLAIIDELSANPMSRQCVLGMWDPGYDLGAITKDKPCNTHIYFRCVGGIALETTVCCRSNDAIWGAYGANVVHFSILHEFIARACGLLPGKMYQLSNNFHIYERHWHLMEKVLTSVEDPYRAYNVKVLPLMKNGPKEWSAFLQDCQRIVLGREPQHSDFLIEVALPMLEFYLDRKKGDVSPGALPAMPECDWSNAARCWVERRINRAESANG